MAEQVPSAAVPDTTPIQRLIRTTRRLLRSSWVITGLGLTVGLLLGTLVAATLLDLAVPVWPAVRLVALLLVVLPAGWVLVTGVLRPLFRRLAPVTVARRIEAHIPGIHNRLVSCLDLAQSQGKQPVSQAFYRRLLREALERIRGFRPGSVVDFHRLRRSGLFALSSTLAFVLAFALFSERLPTAIARILNPFADIPPASGVRYTVTPGNAQVLRGEDVVFTAQVEKGEPEKLYLELTSPQAEKPLRHDLQRQDDNLWKFTLSGKLPAGFENRFAYRVHGGGTWSKQYEITLVERPVIVGLHTVLHYPEYMDLPPETHLSPAQTAEVAGPEGGAIEVVVQAEGDVERGEVQLLRAETQRVPVKDRSERVWFEKDLPTGAQPGVVWKWDHDSYQQVKHSHTDDVKGAAGLHGHWFQGTPTGFQVQPGESLFTFVFLSPDNMPRTLLLEWHDGTDWEHRAYWGAVPDRAGNPNTAGLRQMGPLPPAGGWVRLEVPAEFVGLEGKALHGMGFKVADGRCRWQRAGAIPPSHVEQTVLVPDRRWPMQSQGDNVWSGRFPLQGDGQYRVELHDALGHPNQTMKESKFTTLPDNPPQIVLEKPGPDLALNTPGKVVLEMKAFDDYGLRDVALQVKRGDKGEWSRRVVKQFPKPERDAGDLTATLDLAAMKMVLGDSLRYRLEATDRKGQTTSTPEFTIRLATGPNAADQQLTAFEKTQDPFRDQLTALIAAQNKVHQAVEKLTVKYTPLMNKIDVARTEARTRLDPASAKLVEAMRSKLTDLAREKAAAEQANLPKPPVAEGPPNLDPESAKLLDETKQKLTDLAKERLTNAQPGTPSPMPPATPALDAESRQLLDNVTSKLAELARQKEQNARAGQKPASPLAEAPKLDAESARLLNTLEKKLAELDEEREKNVRTGQTPPGATPSGKSVQLDAESAKQLEAMQKEVAELARQQQANSQQAEQISKDLAKSADEASKLQMMPRPIADQMHTTQQNFEQKAVQAMKDLLASMNRAATAKKEKPPEGKDIEGMRQRADRLQKELEALKDRLQALADARKKVREDADKALSELEKEMLRQDTGMNARELQELRDYLAKLRNELNKQKGDQEQLKDETVKAPDKVLPEVEKKQDLFDVDLDKLLAKAKAMQDEKAKRLKMKRDLSRPKSPYTPEGDEEMVRPKEEDGDDPLPAKKGDKADKADAAKADAAKNDKKKMDDDEDEDDKKYLPQLGGKKEKIDPRYAKKQRPMKKPKKDGEPGDERDDLEARQDQNLRDLDSAEKSVQADEQTLDGMLKQLEQAMKGGKGQNQDADPPMGSPTDAAQQLAQMMQSPALRRALAMAAQMRQAHAGQPNGPRPPMQAAGNPNLNGGPLGKGQEADLSKLEPSARAVILKLQPKAREELLQRMLDGGPEGYEKYIQEYYKRLSTIKEAKK